MANLYELATADAQLYEMLTDADDVPEDQLWSILEASEDAINIKASRIAAVIKALDADSEKCAAMAKKYDAKAKALDNRISSLKRWTISAMKAGNIKKAGDALNSITLAAPRPSVIIDDISIVPSQYVVESVSVRADKNAIKDAIISGNAVEGARIEYNDSIRIN